jgi:hypothetical protein
MFLWSSTAFASAVGWEEKTTNIAIFASVHKYTGTVWITKPQNWRKRWTSLKSFIFSHHRWSFWHSGRCNPPTTGWAGWISWRCRPGRRWERARTHQAPSTPPLRGDARAGPGSSPGPPHPPFTQRNFILLKMDKKCCCLERIGINVKVVFELDMDRMSGRYRYRTNWKAFPKTVKTKNIKTFLYTKKHNKKITPVRNQNYFFLSK